jgi:hypothetical protein
LFRNDVAWWLLGFSFWGGLKYILVMLVLAFNRRIDEAIIQPLIERLIPKAGKANRPQHVAQPSVRFPPGSTSTGSSASAKRTRADDR